MKELLAGLPGAVWLGIRSGRIFTYAWWDFHWRLYLAVSSGAL